MSFLPGIFNRQPAQNQQQQQQQNQQQGPQNQQNPQQQVNSSGSAGPAGQQQQPANQNANPLDPFLQMLTPSPDVQKMYQQQQQQQQQPLFAGLTPDKLKEQVGKTNFMAGVDPQKIQAALGGDVNAFSEVINNAVQQAFMGSTQMAQSMVEMGVNTGMERFGSNLDSRFREFQLKGKNSQNPALQHPAGQAMLNSVKSQIARANPKLSADEVHTQAEQFLTTFAQQLVPQPQQQQQDPQNQQSQMNWLNFIEDPTAQN